MARIRLQPLTVNMQQKRKPETEGTHTNEKIQEGGHPTVISGAGTGKVGDPKTNKRQGEISLNKRALVKTGAGKVLGGTPSKGKNRSHPGLPVKRRTRGKMRVADGINSERARGNPENVPFPS